MPFDFPGVRVTEATAGAIPIDRKSFQAIKLTGTALRGPVGLNRNPITREGLYQDLYGGPVSTSFLADAVRQIFTNTQDGVVFINRVVGSGALVATKSLLATATPTLRVDSIGPGTDYNFVSSPAKGLSITYVDGTLNVYDAGVLAEVYHDVLITNSDASRDLINSSSSLIQVTWLSLAANPDNVATPTGLLSGADGAAVVASDIAGNSGTPSGVWVYNEKELPLGFVLAPGYSQVAVGTALIGVAENSRQLAIIDSTIGTSQSGAVTERNQYTSPKGHALFAYGWVIVSDQITGAKKFVPRSPVRAAHIARSHSQPGFLANVGAGLEYPLRGAIGIETSTMDDPQQGVLNVKGIDVARNFSAFGQGIVHWSARTISTNTLYRFLQVRVILNVIAESVELGLRPYIFRAYDGKGRLGNEMKGSIDGLLWDLWNRESLFGRSAAEAFKTVLASSLNELEQGIINIDVYVKPTPIVERIDVTLFRVPLNFDMQTGEVTIGDIESRA